MRPVYDAFGNIIGYSSGNRFYDGRFKCVGFSNGYGIYNSSGSLVGSAYGNRFYNGYGGYTGYMDGRTVRNINNDPVGFVDNSFDFLLAAALLFLFL